MTQETNEMSAPMLGSQPVAWAVFEADGNCIGTYSTQEHARIVIEELAYDGMVYEPLYRQPGPALTDEERMAIRSGIENCEDNTYGGPNDEEAAAVLRRLLERLG